MMKSLASSWINPFSKRYSFEEKIHFWLRLSILGCFIGHGFWGVMQKSGWLPFLLNFGFTAESGYPLMLTIGVLDILFGIIGFFYPSRAILYWMTFWTVWTALLRPLSVMSIWEFFERGGNWGPPLAFLVLYSGTSLTKGNWKSYFFSKLPVPAKVDLPALVLQSWIFRVFIASLLIGHGGFGLVEAKETLVEHFNAVGIHIEEIHLRMIGLFEMLIGLAVFFRPSSTILWLVFGWKLFTEFLYPVHGRWFEIFETIERMGDYTGPMALLLIMTAIRSSNWSSASVAAAQNTFRMIRLFLASHLVPASLVIALFCADTFGYIQLPYEFSMRRRDNSQMIGRSSASETKKTSNVHIEKNLKSGLELLAELKKGGNIVFVRHFQTQGTRSDLGFNGLFATTSVDKFKDCSWQRILNNKALTNAELVHKASKQFGIEWGKVYSSPFCRSADSARLMSGREPEIVKLLSKDIAEYTLVKSQLEGMKFLNSLQPTPGKNDLVVAHSTQVMAMDIPIEEGEAIVLEKTGEMSFQLKGSIRDFEWVMAQVDPQFLGYQRIPPRNPAQAPK